MMLLWVFSIWLAPCQSSSDGISTTGTHDVRRITRSETANYKRFLGPCLDSIPASIVPFAQGYRKMTRDPPYTTLPCVREGFRAVLDGYESWLELSLGEMAEQAEQVFYQQGLVDPGTPIVSSWSMRLHHSGRSGHTKRNDQNPYHQFHGDYFEGETYVVTAIFYGDISDQLEGGETGFGDSFGEDGSLREGLVVEAKKGRLVLISGGGENFHGVMPIRQPDQQRPTYVFNYKCRQDNIIETEKGEEDGSSREL